MIVIYYVSGFIFPIWGEASTELSRSAKLTDLSAPACAEGRHAARGIVGGWGGYPGYPIRPFILSYVDG